MTLYLLIGHAKGFYEEDYNLICVCDSEERAKEIKASDKDFDTYEIKPCSLNERIVD